MTRPVSTAVACHPPVLADGLQEPFRGAGRLGSPIVGLQEEGATFTIPKQPVRRRLHGIQTFNVLKGGEYFFVPSMSALKWLADLE